MRMFEVGDLVEIVEPGSFFDGRQGYINKIMNGRYEIILDTECRLLSPFRNVKDAYQLEFIWN